MYTFSSERVCFGRIYSLSASCLWALHQREFFSAFISGAQRLPNGNTLVCEGMTGRLFEVTREGEMAWEYVNPFYGPDERFGHANRVFRAYRYDADFPGFKGKELLPERFSWLSNLYR